MASVFPTGFGSRLSSHGLVIAPGAFRMVLALMVFVSHTTRFNIGVLGVMFFFMLSGFWVTAIWRTKFAGHPVAWFYASRYFRILPLFLIVAIPAAVWQGFAVLPNLLLFGIASNREADALSVAWSLDIELQFYLLLPFFLMAVRRVNAVLVIATLPLAAAAWLASAELGAGTVFQYLPAFAIGAWLYDNPQNPSLKTAHLSLLVFVGATGVLAIVPWTASFLFKTVKMPEGTEIFSMLWMLPLVPYVARSLTVRSDSMDRHLGNLSYPFYLVHAVTLAGLATWFAGIPLKLVGLGATVALSLVLYMTIDRPLERLRHRHLTPPHSHYQQA